MMFYKIIICIAFSLVVPFLFPHKTVAEQKKEPRGRISALLVAVNEYCGSLILTVPQKQTEYAAPTGFERIKPNGLCLKFEEKTDRRYYLYNSIPTMKRALETLARKSNRDLEPLITMSEYSGEKGSQIKVIGHEKETLGGESIQRIPSKANIESMLDAFEGAIEENTSDNDLFIFYFTGHGLIPKGDGFFPNLLTHGAKSALKTGTSISFKTLTDAIGKIKGKSRKLIILDICRNEAMTDFNLRDRNAIEKTLQELKVADKNIHVLFSTKEGKYSEVDIENQIGFFTEYLFWAIEGRADGFNEEGTGMDDDDETPLHDGTLTTGEVKGYIHHHLKKLNIQMEPIIFPERTADRKGMGEILYKKDDNPDVVHVGLNVIGPGDDNELIRTSLDFLEKKIKNQLEIDLMVSNGEPLYIDSLQDIQFLKKEFGLDIFNYKAAVGAPQVNPKLRDALKRIKTKRGTSPNYSVLIFIRYETVNKYTLEWIIFGPVFPENATNPQFFTNEKPYLIDELNSVFIEEEQWWLKLLKDMEKVSFPRNNLERMRKIRAECFLSSKAMGMDYEQLLEGGFKRITDPTETKTILFIQSLPQKIREGSRVLMDPEENPRPLRVATRIDSFDLILSKSLCFSSGRKNAEIFNRAKNEVKRNERKYSYHLGGEIFVEPSQKADEFSVTISPIINGNTWDFLSISNARPSFSFVVPSEVPFSNSLSSIGKDLVKRILHAWDVIKKEMPDCHLSSEDNCNGFLLDTEPVMRKKEFIKMPSF